ncbi:MAG TPA: site-specific integrase [Candidatus Treponema faecavium]|nr:site-specific integrase [Candidatus Treponema faecavium]
MISTKLLQDFQAHLVYEEKSPATIRKYLRDVAAFFDFLPLTSTLSQIHKDTTISYKKSLIQRYKAATVNSMIIPLNSFLRWYGRSDLCIQTVKRQYQANYEQTFSRAEYEKLLACAQQHGMPRIYFIMRTLASTGIRISELKYLTYEKLSEPSITVYGKRKQRQIYIPRPLCQQLKQYCEAHNQTEGLVFCGRNKNKLIDPAYIWRELAAVSHYAGITPGKVHAHAFRHFFAKMYIERYQNLTELADMLGHSSLETTRLYTRTSGEEKRAHLEALQL